MRLFANDRLLAPNDEATEAGLGPVFETLLRRLLGGSIVRIDRAAEPREQFALTAHAAAGEDADVLLRRVGDVAAKTEMFGRDRCQTCSLRRTIPFRLQRPLRSARSRL